MRDTATAAVIPHTVPPQMTTSALSVHSCSKDTMMYIITQQIGSEQHSIEVFPLAYLCHFHRSYQGKYTHKH
eukprot:m.885918 g.885918  ORF g.885918 m.885918 type:complete len:72 (+) comp23622_c0_seq28:3880-4095(+)